MGITINKRTFIEYSGVLGVDEVGRGCLAGPVYASSFLVSSISDIEYLEKIGVKDSKQLTAAKRDKIYKVKPVCNNEIKVPVSVCFFL